MTYHVPLQYSKDFTKALKIARVLAKNIETNLKTYGLASGEDLEVFPYSFFYVFYEQYLTIWRDSILNILYALIAIFVALFLFLSFNWIVALITVFTILLIIINLMGLMYFWDISLNAVSLVNLVMVSLSKP